MDKGADTTTARGGAITHWSDRLVTVCLLGMALFELIELHLHVPLAARIAAVLLVVFLLVGQSRLGLRERYLIALAVTATACAFMFSDAPVALIERGFGQATYLAAFMLLLALLRDGAVTSPSVLTLGRYLTHRPPGQRYIAIHAGSHALGMILNFGALSLLGPLIQRGIKADAKTNPELAQWRERRQMSALVRGFSWIIAWSPTAVTQALVASVVSGSKPLVMAGVGFFIALGVVVIGWAEDRITGKRARAQLAAHDALPRPDIEPEPFPWQAFKRFGLVCAALAGISLALVFATGAKVVPALMLASPLVTAVWIWVQYRSRPDQTAAAMIGIRNIARNSIPAGSPEAVTLSAAGYIGIVAAGMSNAPVLADIAGFETWPPIAVYLAVMIIVPAASNLAMPPMLTVTFMGSLYSALPDSQLDPTLLATALALGWTLNLTASPFGATALILGRITSIAGTTLSWKWNTTFTIAAFLWAALVLGSISVAAGNTVTTLATTASSPHHAPHGAR
ncbi:MAG: hypothetical protein ACR2OL_08460 [Anderseniella sp.]